MDLILPACRSEAARLLRSWVRIPPRAWMSVCCECCVLWGRGLCDELITRPEESYRLWCVVVCYLETSWMRMPWPTGELSLQKQQTKSFRPYYDPEVHSASNRHEYLGFLVWGNGGRCMGLTNLPLSCTDCLEILGTSNSSSPRVLSSPVIG